jgi:hypothetical protein
MDSDNDDPSEEENNSKENSENEEGSLDVSIEIGDFVP